MINNKNVTIATVIKKFYLFPVVSRAVPTE